MRRWIFVVVVLLAAGSLFLTLSTTSGAAPRPRPPRNPLSIKGSVVAGVTAVSSNSGHDLTFDFTIRNRGSDPVAIDFDYTTTDAQVLDYICPLISNGTDINADSPACEPGTLPGHGVTQSAIVVQTPSSAGTIVVQACADDDGNGATPRCTALSVPVTD
jgi:hypothetical protein